MYGFDSLTDRKNSYSYKWDVADGELPMWVADMDFETAPPIKEAIERRAQHGIFGYSVTPDELFSSVSGYWKRRHGFAIPTEWMIYSSGVVAAISSIVRRLTLPGEKVLIQAPVYNIFYNSILNNGREVCSCDLVYKEGAYKVDFDALDSCLADPQVSLMILCNPHNPVGRVWSPDELAKIGELCHRHGVTVLSDEIHCDITAPGVEYTPFASVNDTCADISVSCIAPSKTFNLAGLQTATVFAKDPMIRHRVFRGINNDEVGEPGAFAVCASIAAYNQCDGWVDALRAYVFENRRIACDYINERIPAIKPISADATYLLWIDISGVSDNSVEFVRRVREISGLYLSDGAEYGACSRGFVRMNLGTQRSRIQDGLCRLERAVTQILAKDRTSEK